MKFIIFNTMVLLLFSFSSFAQPAVKSVSAIEFKNIINNKSIIIIDVRTKEEYVEGHIPLSINIDVNDSNFASKIKSIYKSKTIALYCRSGRRSKLAVSKLSELNTKIFDLNLGILEWKKEGFPISTK